MFDWLGAEKTVDWLALLWTIFGTGILWMLKRTFSRINAALKMHSQLTEAVLGDPKSNTPSIRDLLAETDRVAREGHAVALEASSAVAAVADAMKVHRADFDTLSEAFMERGHAIRSMEQTQSELTQSIEKVLKELSHNGGSSMKDLVRDAKQAIQHLAGLFRANADMNDHIATFSTDVNGLYLWVSKSYQHWTLCSYPQLEGNGWLNSVHQQDRDTVRQEWHTAIEDVRDFHMEYRMIDSEGDHFWVRVQTRRIPGPNNTVLGWYGIIAKMDEDEVVKLLATRG